jgi:hypothetical protein
LLPPYFLQSFLPLVHPFPLYSSFLPSCFIRFPLYPSSFVPSHFIHLFSILPSSFLLSHFIHFRLYPSSFLPSCFIHFFLHPLSYVPSHFILSSTHLFPFETGFTVFFHSNAVMDHDVLSYSDQRVFFFFSQFCDVKDLAKISNKIAKLVKFYTRKEKLPKIAPKKLISTNVAH